MPLSACLLDKEKKYMYSVCEEKTNKRVYIWPSFSVLSFKSLFGMGEDPFSHVQPYRIIFLTESDPVPFTWHFQISSYKKQDQMKMSLLEGE